MDLDRLAERIFRNHDISAEEMRSGSRWPKVVKARQVLIWFCVREVGYPGADVARYPGVRTSCVNRFISLEKKPDGDLNTHSQ